MTYGWEGPKIYPHFGISPYPKQEVVKIFVEGGWWRRMTEGAPRQRRQARVVSPRRRVKVQEGQGVGTGVSGVDASWMAGLQAARAAKQAAGKDVHLGVVFMTAEHDFNMVLKGVAYGLGSKIPLVGATTYGYVFDNHDAAKPGVGVLALGGDHVHVEYGLGSNLSGDLWSAVRQAVHPVLEEWEAQRAQGRPFLSIFFLVDRFTNGEILLEALVRELPSEDIPVFGGIVDEEGSEQNALVFEGQTIHDGILVMGIFSSSPAGVGYRHGFFPLVPRRVTRVSGTVIHELDGRPAIEVWKEFLKRKKVDVGDSIEEFGRALARFQFAIPDPMQGGTSKIRLPLGVTEDGGIRLAGEVPDKATIWILEARKERMLEALSKAFTSAREYLQAPPLFGLVLHGFSRTFALGEEGFQDEMNTLRELFGDIPYLGLNSYGEIVRVEGQPRGFSNSSVVISLFPGTEAS